MLAIGTLGQRTVAVLLVVFMHSLLYCVDELLPGWHLGAEHNHLTGLLGAAQGALLFLGYKPGDPDGVLGQNTRRAILAFRVDAQMGASEDLDDAVFNAIMGKAGLS